MVGVEALRPGGRGLMSRSRIGGRGVASRVSREFLCARRLYVRVGVPGLVRTLGGGSGTTREGSVRVRGSGAFTFVACGEGVARGRRVDVGHDFESCGNFNRRNINTHPSPNTPLNAYRVRVIRKREQQLLTLYVLERSRIIPIDLYYYSNRIPNLKFPGNGTVAKPWRAKDRHFGKAQKGNAKSRFAFGAFCVFAFRRNGEGFGVENQSRRVEAHTSCGPDTRAWASLCEWL